MKLAFDDGDDVLILELVGKPNTLGLMLHRFPVDNGDLELLED